MKISLVTFCIVTLVLMLCSMSVEANPKKCKPPLKWNAKTKKCAGKAKAGKKTTAAAGAAGETTAAAATTAAPA
ncbi:uncharacterized protein LOC108093568 [Drosophila ficusphila]|uniref:uncharacterized protein LOC108093568 n=1 Tax=Drosophila ficusphila TaxID=30025 RepID=UPI0007E7DF5B|nr:uncharacterized protein LOC108093568 [Drosophila ficusphila]